MRAGAHHVALATAVLLAAGCAHLPPDDPADPLETLNRKVYTFNEVADHFVVRPVARAYDWAMPSFARTGVGNFFANLGMPTVILNDLLQFKGQALARDVSRFLINSTFGLGGLVDVAGYGGLHGGDEDFGQTLGHWGVNEGWYFVLPLLGPYSMRDGFGALADAGTSPTFLITDDAVSWGLWGLDKVEQRADFIPLEKVLEQQFDRYVFIRTVYLQSRQAKVYDGRPPPEDYGFEEEFEEELE